MSASTSKISSAQNAHISSANKQSIPLPHSAQLGHPSAHASQLPAHLAAHAHQKSHAAAIPQSQKQHLGPPRYQPPPPPGGSILKHVSPQRSGIPTLFHHSAHTAEANAHLNLKFPQDVPQLTSVCIPDRSGPHPSRIATARSLTRQSLNGLVQQQQPSPHPPSTDDEQTGSARGHQQDMLKFVRKSDGDQVPAHSPNPNVNGPNAGNMMRMASAEQNRHFQSLVAELRTLKEANQRLSDDNQELRDLCCFLDDDRQKGRKLAREWQRFGRYTASVMRQEVSAYQSKLRQLDDKQQELIRDNLELKELCLYLDEERAHLAANIPSTCSSCGASVRATSAAVSNHRDDGDGSSSSTNDEPMPSVHQLDQPDAESRSALNDQTLQYVRMLERRLMEHELATGITARHPNNENMPMTNGAIKPPSSDTTSNSNNNSNNSNSSNTNSTASTTGHNVSKALENGPANGIRSSDILSGRPEAVVRALQILEVREQLERGRAGNAASVSPEHMDDGEKALLREMCNVVWRKLEEHPNSQDPL